MGKSLSEMVDELDFNHRMELVHVVDGLLKVQELEEQIAKSTDEAIANVRKYKPISADHAVGNGVECSFCRKWSSEVELMITNEGRAYICSECVDHCYEILDNERKKRREIRSSECNNIADVGSEAK